MKRAQDQDAEDDFLQRHVDAIAEELDYQDQLRRVAALDLTEKQKADVIRRLDIIRHNENCGFFDKPESEYFDNEDIPSNFGMCIYVVAFIAFIIYAMNRDPGKALPLPHDSQAQHESQ